MTTSSPLASPRLAGHVAWSGDNPGIYLQDGQGRWQTLAVYFRVVVSPYGSGCGMLVLGDPDGNKGWPDSPNLLIGDNEPLMRWLVSDFVSRFASFRGKPGLASMSYLPSVRHQSTGDGRTYHEEHMAAQSVHLTMRWDDLAAPFAADVPPALSATGEHRMTSVFVEASQGKILLNGHALPGALITRDFLGGRMSTAFLAFSETWIRP